MSSKKVDLNLDAMRHSCSHVLAQAVLEMFPDAKLGIGPTIENGFYYDFDLPRTLIPEDLPILEKKMKHIIKQTQKFRKYEEPAKKSIDFFKKINQPYKVELIKDLVKDGEKTVSFYENLDQNGEGKFVDLCKGPHIEHTGQIGAFKLTHTAGAYWRGDEKRPMLQRIYGVCFAEQKELEEYLKMLEEAKKRDHRKLGKDLKLFMISQEAGAGLPLWLPRGAIVRDQLQAFLKKKQVEAGYSIVTTPHIGKLDLYKTSGHWEHYRECMYSPIQIEEEEYLLKPMNCPHHVMMYKNEPQSYRDLPIRYAEFGTVYRYEKSGELNGLVRVRGFTQDDAHIFCRPDQLKQEFLSVLDIILYIFKTLGFTEYRSRIGLRDPQSKKYIGSDENWKRAEAEIEEAVKEVGMKYTKEEGDAAFYGPKLDFMVKDVLGREWQLGTIQVDYNLPERFDLEYIGEDGLPHRPVMIHRAPFGSLERFTGILIEHFAGAFPAWLAPEQAIILPVSDQFMDYASKVFDELNKAGLRAALDRSSETLGKKIRNAELMKIPYMLVVGEKEVGSCCVAVRDYATKKQVVMKVSEFKDKVLKESLGNL